MGFKITFSNNSYAALFLLDSNEHIKKYLIIKIPKIRPGIILTSEFGKIFHRTFGQERDDTLEAGDYTSHSRKSSPISKLLLTGAETGISPVVLDMRIKLSSERVRNTK